ncbi:MAG: peroxide stress protein YaaA [Bacteroidetes bacterium]|nr:MAG: peroxide stress protein YaaA [Bacteroidota bacterium]
MLIVISPAKSLDFSHKVNNKEKSEPIFLNEASVLIEELRKYKPEELSSLMSISAKLAELNYERFIKWHLPFTSQNAKPAINVFKGDVYLGLDAKSLSAKEIKFANNHLRILSGLYGILSPLDLIQEYRLEMGAKLTNLKGKNLYEFWGNKITIAINKAIEESSGDKVLINLASNEYFKSIQKKHLNYEVVTPVFKDYKNGQYKIISFFAKKARGLMSRFIIQNNINKAENIKAFDSANYHFSPELSKEKEWVFTR